jgi:hypothetical protein
MDLSLEEEAPPLRSAPGGVNHSREADARQRGFDKVGRLRGREFAMRSERFTAAFALALAVAGCAAPEKPRAPVHRPPPPPRPTPTYSISGLEGVIGRTAKLLIDQFGKPELDMQEGDARKLQFAGPICVLDAYLYRRAGGGDPVVTYVDARQPDGRDFDRASCVAALSRRQEAR